MSGNIPKPEHLRDCDFMFRGGHEMVVGDILYAECDKAQLCEYKTILIMNITKVASPQKHTDGEKSTLKSCLYHPIGTT
jgi:hypothetical protein